MTYSEFDDMVIRWKDYLVLRKLRKNKKTKIDADSINRLYAEYKLISPTVFVADFDGKFPEDRGYVITDKGNLYFTFVWKRFFRFLRNSILFPIIVAAIVAFITTLITNSLVVPPAQP